MNSHLSVLVYRSTAHSPPLGGVFPNRLIARDEEDVVFPIFLIVLRPSSYQSWPCCPAPISTMTLKASAEQTARLSQPQHTLVLGSAPDSFRAKSLFRSPPMPRLILGSLGGPRVSQGFHCTLPQERINVKCFPRRLAACLWIETKEKHPRSFQSVLRSQSSFELGEDGQCSALSHFFESLPCQLSGGKPGRSQSFTIWPGDAPRPFGEAQAINGVTGAGAFGEAAS